VTADPALIDQPMDRAPVDAHVETQTAPTLRHGRMAILDACLVTRAQWLRLSSISVTHRSSSLEAVGDVCALSSEQERRSNFKDAGYAPIERSML